MFVSIPPPILASFWTVEEVDLSKDLADWERLKVWSKKKRSFQSCPSPVTGNMELLGTSIEEEWCNILFVFPPNTAWRAAFHQTCFGVFCSQWRHCQRKPGRLKSTCTLVLLLWQWSLYIFSLGLILYVLLCCYYGDGVCTQVQKFSQ